MHSIPTRVTQKGFESDSLSIREPSFAMVEYTKFIKRHVNFFQRIDPWVCEKEDRDETNLQCRVDVDRLITTKKIDSSLMTKRSILFVNWSEKIADNLEKVLDAINVVRIFLNSPKGWEHLARKVKDRMEDATHHYRAFVKLYPKNTLQCIPPDCSLIDITLEEGFSADSACKLLNTVKKMRTSIIDAAPGFYRSPITEKPSTKTIKMIPLDRQCEIQWMLSSVIKVQRYCKRELEHFAEDYIKCWMIIRTQELTL